jgi:hypothetical protein
VKFDLEKLGEKYERVEMCYPMEYAYYTNRLFAILRASFALMFICYRYKSIVANAALYSQNKTLFSLLLNIRRIEKCVIS